VLRRRCPIFDCRVAWSAAIRLSHHRREANAVHRGTFEPGAFFIGTLPMLRAAMHRLVVGPR
jgi:hypothetical protein